MVPDQLVKEPIPGKILLSTAERIGDTLFVLPAIRFLKENLPDVQLDVLAYSKLAATIFERNPYINQIHIATSPATTRNVIAAYPLTINLMYEMLKKIGKIPKNNFLSIGVPNLNVHRTQQAVDYVKSLLPNSDHDVSWQYDIFPTSTNYDTVKNLLSAHHVDLDNDILVACQLGCHRVAKRGWKFWHRKRHEHKKVWKIENYAELANRLMATNKKIKIILTGAPSEKFLAPLFLPYCPAAIDLIGATSLHELTALLNMASVLVTHDTGTLHLACSQKTRLVAMFGPTPISFTGPFPMQPQYTILQKPHMSDISIDETFDAVINLLTHFQ